MPTHTVLFSPAFAEAHHELAIATLDVRSIDRDKLGARIKDAAEVRLAAAASMEQRIMEHVEMYELFFKELGITSPLRRQLETTRVKGLPNIDPVVRLLLLAEMTTGVLMGVHDSDSMRGAVTFDIAAQGESFEGMRAAVQCGRREIVARDEFGIIFSYFQGADRRTCVRPQATNVVYFAFGVRSLPPDDLLSALSVVADVAGDSASLGSPAIHTAARLGGS